MTEVPAGVLGSLLAGVVNGSFATPTKYTSRWRWENIWAVWAVTALLVVPWVAAWATVPRLAVFYRETSSALLSLLFGLGLGVGLSQIFFGLALAEVGLSIGFAVTLGLSTAIGSILPLVILDPRALLAHKGLTVLRGVGLMLAGTALCGVSSKRRDRKRNSSASPRAKGAGSGKGSCCASWPVYFHH
jgi:L-rhamnose-H+ transport protein